MALEPGLFSARGRDERPYLDTSIAGRKHRLLIDSGSSGSIAVHDGRDLPLTRHSAVTNVYRATRDLFLAQRFARHASPLTTTTYTHPGDEEMRSRLRNLNC